MSKSNKKSKKAGPKKVARKATQMTTAPPGPKPFTIVGIGASAGGLQAYLELFEKLPPDTGMAFVLVQHLAPKHLSILSGIVQKSTKMSVQEIEDGTRALPNHVYVIPPNQVLEIFHGVLHLRPMAKDQSTNRLIDTFFTALARDHGNLAVGVVLSGTGSDGSQGLRDIKAEGGISLVQDPETAKFDGMPRMAIAIDHPDRVLPIEGLVAELVKIATNPHVAKLVSSENSDLSPADDHSLQKIFAAVRAVTGTDFSAYKYPTLLRRIRRRIVLHRLESLKQYLSFLHETPGEAKALFKDLLINVTEFFRNSAAFEALRAHVYPRMIEDRPDGTPIRIWVPGCSTGEEVFSIAITLLEFLGDAAARWPVQIYGTDIGESIIKTARAGFYSDAIATQVSADRLLRYFVKEDNGYRISRQVRDCCIFSIQDITSDPPIHRLDFLSCRNLMIYLAPATQKKMMETFFYALKPTGYLLLGSSESVGAAASLFLSVDDKSKIYSKRVNVAPPSRLPMEPTGLGRDSAPSRALTNVLPLKVPARTDPVTLAQELVLEKHAPAWILVNRMMDIVHFRGNTERFIAPRSGQPSWNLIKMIREELVADVRIILHEAEKEDGPARKAGITYRSDYPNLRIDIEAVAIHPPGIDAHYLVVFFEHANDPPQSASKTPGTEAERLTAELTSTRKTLRSLLEEQKYNYEELQSANEEVLSSNEELQSTNEELETAKEELQSTNEELITLNEELSRRNAELNIAHDDLANILNNAQVAIIIVDSKLHIRRFTPAAGALLKIMPTDVGRFLFDFNIGFPSDTLGRNLNDVIMNNVPIELEANDEGGKHYSLRLRPYKTTDQRIDGAVLTFIDVNILKSKERLERKNSVYSNAIIQTIHDPLLVLDRYLRVERANRSFAEMFKVDPEQLVGKVLYDIGNGQWNIPELRELLEDLLSHKVEIRDYKVSHTFETIGYKEILINAQRLEWEEQEDPLILLAFRDITPAQ